MLSFIMVPVGRNEDLIVVVLSGWNFLPQSQIMYVLDMIKMKFLRW